MHYSKPVHDTINYINTNLTTEISLEVLAERVHFSPYHFHRLFHLYTKETPMEYVRRQRLNAASQDLLSINLNIIEIAIKYQFESQDGFCRAFKKYYGFTPSDYKKLNFKNQIGHARPIKEVKNTMYDIIIYEKIECSHDDKKEALDTLDKILQLSEKTRNSGLLSLEEEIEILEPEMFKKSIQLLIDGVEPESIKEILLNYTLCCNFTGKELLIRILIIEGILAIQQGIHPIIIREKLSSFFGENFICEIQKHFGLDSESQLKSIETYILKNQNKPVISKDTSFLEEPFSRMSNRSLQRLLREIETCILITALSGSSGSIQSKVLRNVSKKLAILLIDELSTIDNSNISEIANSQKQVLKIMNELKNQGELII